VGFTPAQRLEVEQAVAQGISRRRISQQIVRRAQREQKPVDELVGATPSARARARSSSGMVPSDVERQRVSEASPRPGESVWGFLERHAERLGIMMWMSPRGDLVLGSPNYSGDSLYRFVRRFTNDATDPNNFEAGTHKLSGADRYSKVTVYGRAHGSDVTRSRIRAVVKDDTLPFERRKIDHRAECTTVELARRAAKRLSREGVAAADVADIIATDHGQGRYLYAIDTVADFVDEYSDRDERRYVVSRTFERSRDTGTHTQLRLVPLGSLTL
jgi:prophage tail gpP-like protein